MAQWWNRLRELVFSSGLGPFIIIPIAWLGAWVLQLGMTSLQFLPATYLIFFPAGVRTVAVFIYGLRGALIAGGCALVSTTVLLNMSEGSIPSLYPAVLFALFPAIFSWITMLAVCRWANIPKSLSGLNARHVLAIVVTQGLAVVTVKQAIFFEINHADLYENAGIRELLTRWFAMFAGDVLGSMVGIVGLIGCYALASALRSRKA